MNKKVYQCGHCGTTYSSFDECKICCDCVEVAFECEGCKSLFSSPLWQCKCKFAKLQRGENK